MKRLGKDSDLEQRVRRDLSFLFDRYGAAVTSSTAEPHGIFQVSVAIGHLEFRFSRNERDGEDLVQVAPRDGRGIWELLDVALAASSGEDVKTLNCPVSFTDDPDLLSYLGLTRLASVLRPRLEHLNDAFAPENYPATRLRMAQIERSIHPHY